MAEVVNPVEGRVPVSWNECADWLDAGGVVWLYRDSRPTNYGANTFRSGSVLLAPPDEYHLLPPPNLVAAPESMDGGGWLGQGKDVPDGWEWRTISDGAWRCGGRPHDVQIVQCRPPAPKREPEWVPLTKLVGRTVWGETEAVVSDPCPTAKGWVWPSARTIKRFPDGTLDLDTGRVKVEPEEQQ